MLLDEVAAHAAAESKDRRYDGVFFVGVTSTGIYCRPVCPARTPRREHRRFFPSAAAAEKGGFRPCLRCRPECAPGASAIDATERLAHDAVRRIEAGALEEQGLEGLAGELGVTGRHLRRVIMRTFGATPVELAQTHRLLTAKRLLRDTELGMSEVAFAAGFQSLRRFNALFRTRYGLTPSRIRGGGGVRAPSAREAGAAALVLELSARGPFDGNAPLAHLAARRIARLESPLGATGWARAFSVAGHRGVISLELGGPSPRLAISEGLVPALRQVVAAVRGALDLDADVAAIDAALSLGPELAPDVAREPGVRLTGALDPFEAMVRAVIGQQVSVKAAVTIASRLVADLGAPIDGGIAGIDRTFPSAERLAEAGVDRIAKLGMPGARAETLTRIAARVANRELVLARGAIWAGRSGLSGIPGVGPWTREYVALRALGDPDAFPLGDAGLRAAYPGALAEVSERWRPWRAYAATRLWRRPVAPRRRS